MPKITELVNDRLGIGVGNTCDGKTLARLLSFARRELEMGVGGVEIESGIGQIRIQSQCLYSYIFLLQIFILHMGH